MLRYSKFDLILPSGEKGELLDWLKNTVFPEETKYETIEYASKIFQEVVRRTIAYGVRASVKRNF